MPKRVIDFDAMWGSDKLASCASWAQGEYAWLYGLADASGCFELTNLRVIWGRVAAIRENLTIERLEQVFAEFQDKGLLFVWEHEGKRYAHWTGSDVPGRLPAPSWRMRLERFAPPVPKQQLAEYMARFARGRAALAGGGFRGEADRKEDLGFETSNLKEERGVGERVRNSQFEERHAAAATGGRDDAEDRRGELAGRSGRKGVLEEAQAQDLDLDRNLNWEMGKGERRGGAGDAQACARDADRGKNLKKTDFIDTNANDNSKSLANTQINISANANSESSSNSRSESNARLGSNASARSNANAQASGTSKADLNASVNSNSAGDGTGAGLAGSRAERETAQSAARFGWRDKDLAVARELRVGQGPVCGPIRVRPEILERERLRAAARAGP